MAYVINELVKRLKQATDWLVRTLCCNFCDRHVRSCSMCLHAPVGWHICCSSCLTESSWCRRC